MKALPRTKGKGRIQSDAAPCPGNALQEASPAREIVQSLQRVLAKLDRLSLPTGRLGTELSKLDESLTPERSLARVRRSFASIHRLGDYPPDEIEHVLREVTHHREGSVRLSRVKEES